MCEEARGPETRGPGRPREFDEDVALDAIMQVFWDNGYEGTSLSDIMAATGLKKASLYGTFGDKQEMYLKALARYHEEAVRKAADALREDGNPRQRIRAFLSAPIDAMLGGQDRRGCFLCNASADHAASSPETARIVQRGFETMASALAHALKDLKPGATAARLKAEAWMLLSVYSGLRIMVRSGLSVDHLTTARDAAVAVV